MAKAMWGGGVKDGERFGYLWEVNEVLWAFTVHVLDVASMVSAACIVAAMVFAACIVAAMVSAACIVCSCCPCGVNNFEDLAN
ncbi:hypothetical protein Tco_0155573 [Tanacetum coccineum]